MLVGLIDFPSIENYVYDRERRLAYSSPFIHFGIRTHPNSQSTATIVYDIDNPYFIERIDAAWRKMILLNVSYLKFLRVKITLY